MRFPYVQKSHRFKPVSRIGGFEPDTGGTIYPGFLQYARTGMATNRQSQLKYRLSWAGKSMAITGFSLFYGCGTPVATRPEALKPYRTEDPKIIEEGGFTVFEEGLPARSYTVLGYVELEAPANLQISAVYDRLREKARAMGGNAIFEILRRSRLQTGNPSAALDLGMSNPGGYGSGTITEIYYWRATVISQ